MDKLWIVVSLNELEMSHQKVPDSYTLEWRRRPSVLYWYRIDAEREAERLVNLYGGQFAIFECVAEVRRGPELPNGVAVPTYDRTPERYQ